MMRFAALVMGLYGVAAMGGERFCLETDDFALFPQPSQVQIGEKGLIYIADPDVHAIRVFDRDGRHRFSVARSGQGPGEIKRWFGEFDLGEGDAVWQVDFWGGNQWINRFTAKGELMGIVPLKSIGGVFGPQRVLPLGGGELVLGVARGWRTQKRGPLYFGGSAVVFVRMDETGEVGATLFELERYVEISHYPDKEGRPIPHAPYLLSDCHRQTGLLAWQMSDWEETRLVNLKTGEARVFKNGFKPRFLTVDEIETFMRERLAAYPAYRTYEKKLYEDLIDIHEQEALRRSTVGQLFFAADGALVLTGAEAEDDGYRVRKFSPQGALLAERRSPHRPAAVTADEIFWLERDESEDRTYLRIEPRQAGGL